MYNSRNRLPADRSTHGGIDRANLGGDIIDILVGYYYCDVLAFERIIFVYNSSMGDESVIPGR